MTHDNDHSNDDGTAATTTVPNPQQENERYWQEEGRCVRLREHDCLGPEYDELATFGDRQRPTVMQDNCYFHNVNIVGAVYCNGHALICNRMRLIGPSARIERMPPSPEVLAAAVMAPAPWMTHDPATELLVEDGFGRSVVKRSAVNPKALVLFDRQRNDFVQGDVAWLNYREGKVTASDLPAIFGQCHYKSPSQIFALKTYQVQPDAMGPACAHGHRFEPAAAAEYSRRTGRRLIAPSILDHPDTERYPFLAASPDRISIGEDGEEPISVEIKCPFGSRSIDTVPPQYTAQIQLQLECFDLEVCHFVQFRKPRGQGIPYEYTCIEVRRDREWFARHVPLVEKFWADVLAYRAAHPGAREALAERVREEAERALLISQGKRPALRPGECEIDGLDSIDEIAPAPKRHRFSAMPATSAAPPQRKALTTRFSKYVKK